MNEFIKDVLQPAIQDTTKKDYYTQAVHSLRICWAADKVFRELGTKKERDTFQLIKYWMYEYIAKSTQRDPKKAKLTKKINQLMLTDDVQDIITKIGKMVK